MSSCELFSGRVEFGIERGVVVPASPYDPNPCPGQDSHSVGMAASSGNGSLIDLHRPGITQTAAVRKVHDGGSELLVT